MKTNIAYKATSRTIRPFAAAGDVTDGESVAVLTIKHADKMTARQRRQVAKWLADQAHALQTQGSHYSSRFRARYMSR